MLFPFLNTKLDFSTEIAQHEKIHAALEEIAATVKAYQGTNTLFDGKDLQAKMQALKDPLVSRSLRRRTKYLLTSTV